MYEYTRIENEILSRSVAKYLLTKKRPNGSNTLQSWKTIEVTYKGIIKKISEKSKPDTLSGLGALAP